MKKGLALLLVLAMVLAMTACARSDVVAVIGKTEIHLPEALEVYDFVYKQMASYYGSALTSGDAGYDDFVTSIKSMTLELIVEVEVMEQKLNELGLALTEEELALIDTTAQEERDMMVASYVAGYGVTEEEAQAMADEEGYSMKALTYLVRRYEVQAKLQKNVLTIVAPTEEEIQSDYSMHVSEQQASYDELPAQYGTDVLYGSTIYYRPAGYRYIKNLVIGFPEDTQAEISTKNSELQIATYEKTLLESQLSTDAELDDAGKAELEAQIAEKDTLLTQLTDEIAALHVTATEAIREEAEAVLALAKAEGANFDALLAEYNDDTVTDTGILANGYQVSADSTNFVSSFTEGAMALASIGDVSDLVESSYGFHILMYAGDVPSGPVPLEEVREGVSAHLQADLESRAFSEQMAIWVEKAAAKTYTSRMTVK